MKKYILDFVCKLEGYKTAIKQFHWNPDNMSQHKLCDDIADDLSDFQDTIAEVEQALHGNLAFNKLKPTPYKLTSIKKFMDDIVSSTKNFYSKLKGEGDDYIGMRSDTEAFISTIQRKIYLVDITIKEDLKRRLANRLNENKVTLSNGVERYQMTENEARKLVNEAIRNVLDKHINESMPKNAQKASQIDKLMGRRPTTIKSRINQIYRLVQKYGLNKKYSDEHWQALKDYAKVIGSYADGFDYWCENGGYCDYDREDNMPRSKQWNIRISFDDGMEIEGYIKAMAAGTMADPFSSYDTTMVLWPKERIKLEGKENMITISEEQIGLIVKNAIKELTK